MVSQKQRRLWTILAAIAATMWGISGIMSGPKLISIGSFFTYYTVTGGHGSV